MKKILNIGLTVCALFFADVKSALALPAYSRLYQAKYGYRVNCQLCHSSGGGSAVNEYGRDFLRAGANLAAFLKVETLDSDQDGSFNGVEIQQKSNPGDERSQPLKPGDWLDQSDRTPIPQKELKELFPDAEAFAGLEGSLRADQVQKVETLLDVKLTDEDKVPTFYMAVKNSKKYAVAQFLSVPNSKGLLSVAVAIDTSATVTTVHILKNPANKAIEDKAFLKQFEGKRQNDALQMNQDLKTAAGAEQLSQDVATAVHKALAIMNIVFGK